MYLFLSFIQNISWNSNLSLKKNHQTTINYADLFIVLSVQFDFGWSTRYSLVFLSVYTLPCPALTCLELLKTVYLSYILVCMFLDPPLCVHRDKFKVRRSACVAKDSPRITDGELQRLVESKWQKDKQIKKFKQPLHHHMLFGRVSRNILLVHPKTNSSISSCQTWLLLQMRLASMVRWNLKKSFLAAHPPDGFGANPMLTVKYTAWSLMSRACFSAEGTGLLVQRHHGFYHIPTDEKSKPDWLPMLEIL